MVKKQWANDRHIHSFFHPFTCSCVLSIINRQRDVNKECWGLSSKCLGFSSTEAVSCIIHSKPARDFCSPILEQDVEERAGGGTGAGSLQGTKRLGLSPS